MRLTLSNYHTITKLHEGTTTSVYRAQKDDGQTVVLKVLNGRYPTPQQLAPLEHEFHLLHDLHLSGVITAYLLASEEQQHFIVLEDFGGQSLSQLALAGNLTTAEFFVLALKISTALGQLHQQQIIHKDINPANILFNPQTGQVKLIDFDLATSFISTQRGFTNPHVLVGTLAYMSPEQTGRVNRPVDYRTDFYSLGATLYELLTGKRPFEASEPMEIVHSHIARQPTAPDQLGPNIAPALAQIILKLLAKNAEDRYQTAVGLQADLQTCLDQHQMKGYITDFVLGQQDRSGRLHFSQKLYGRQAEVTLLLDACQAACQGQSKQLFVTGHSGVGKSSLVREVYHPLTTQRGIFLEGKFDALQRNVPYFGWRQALSQFVTYLLTEPEERTAVWRDKILEAVGENGQVLTAVIPNLSLLLGPQPDAPALEAVEAKNRFRYLIERFFQVIASPEHPICIFLDDLQWADAASLTLLQHLLQDSLPYTFVIGAYRDNEVSPTHYLQQVLHTLQEDGIHYQTIHLQNLSVPQVNQLIGDALTGAEDTADLATLVHQKTEGNAFFVKAFLQDLYEKQLLQFQNRPKQAGWHWSLATIHQLGATSNVIDLLADKVRTLPTATQDILKLAACISPRFDLPTLAIMASATPQQISQYLKPALVAEIVIPDDPSADNQASYRFVHDRIQLAAHSLLTPQEQQHYHWQIGNIMWNSMSPAERVQRPFAILNQWQAALGLLESKVEKTRFSQLSLAAGRRAKAAAAFSSAYKYLQKACQLLQVEQPDYWQTDYDLVLALTTEMAEAAYLVGQSSQAEQFIALILSQAKSLLDTLPAYEIRMQAHIAQNKMEEAGRIGLQILEKLGEHFPSEPTPNDIKVTLAQTQTKLQVKPLATLLDLPEMTEPISLATMRLLFVTNLSLFFTNPQLSLLVSLRLINFSLLHGSTPATGWTYTLCAYVLCGYEGDIETAFTLGELGQKLLAQNKAGAVEARSLHLFATFVQHWKQHVQETLPLLLKAHRVGLESGDPVFAGFAIGTYCQYSYLAGKELGQLHQEMTMYGEVLIKFNQDFTFLFLRVDEQAVLNLLDHDNEEPHRLSGTACREQDILALGQESSNNALLFTFYLHKMILCFLFHVYPEALEHAEIARPHLNLSPGTLRISIFCFYDSLIRLAMLSAGSEEERQFNLQYVTQNQANMKHWVHHAPMNYQHKWHLVEAERYRVLGQPGEAREHYDAAIGLTQQHGYIQEAALAHELAGLFYLDRDQPELAEFYLQRSSHLYAQWGAVAKVRHLADCYPQFFEPALGFPATVTSSDLHLLDMHTLLQAAQALSQEVDLSRLLAKLMELVMENVGAERGVLLLVREGEWLVEAETAVNHPSTLLQAQPLALCEETMATAVVHYVRQTHENIVIENAAQSDLFGHDPYIARQQPQSILCSPIQYQGQLGGILYLENNLTPGTFSTDRVELLNNLLTQAAISLENARLYSSLTTEIAERKQVEADLRRNEERFRALFDNTNDAVFTVDTVGKILTANQQAVEMIGYSLEELTTMTYHDVAPSGEIADADNKFAQLLQRDLRMPVYERVLRKKDGTEFPVEINVGVVHDQEGQPMYFQSVVRDITERKLAEAALQKNEQRYRALFERSNDAVFIMSLEGVYLAANQQAVEMLGYATDELVGMTYKSVVVPDEFDEAGEKLALMLTGANVPIYERKFRKKDGSVFLVEINVALVSDENGQPLHIQGIVRDISERKRIEAQILASLQEKVVMLKEIHHRVKNNLQVISSLLDLQAGYVTDIEVQNMLHDSRSRVRSMALVHEQLYQASDLARIDMTDYIERLTGFLFRSYGKRASLVDLRLDIDSVFLSVETAVPLGLIINELVSNAYKHAFPDGRSGQIHIGLQIRDGNQFCLSVKDNGIGFPEDIDFRRSPSLGLTIIMTLVDQLWGQIELISDIGTCFELTFLSEDGIKAENLHYETIID